MVIPPTNCVCVCVMGVAGILFSHPYVSPLCFGLCRVSNKQCFLQISCLTCNKVKFTAVSPVSSYIRKVSVLFGRKRHLIWSYI